MTTNTGPQASGAALQLRALGGLDIRWRGESLHASLPGKALAVLVLLADAERPIARRELAGLLWSDLTEERARANLRLVLTKVRRISAGILDADRRSVWLAADVEYDVSSVEDGSVAEVARGYSGDFLDGIELDGADLFDQWVRARRHSLRLAALAAFSAASSEAAAEGTWSRVIELAGRVLEIEPWNELAHRQLMVALERTSGRSAALAQFDHCERLLNAELGVGPEPATVALADRINAGATSPSLVGGSAMLGVPRTLTPMVGRDADIGLITSRLTGAYGRLVTLLGPGGVGKTRLAIAALEQVRREFELVVFVSLVGVRSGREALSAVHATLNPDGVLVGEPLDQVVSVFDSRHCLVVLDNLEHLVSDLESPMAEILERCPNTTLVVTSRQALGLAAEDVLEIDGLPVPDRDATDIESFASVRLFVDRAYRIDKSFTLTTSNQPDVARLCRLVEGRPLYLELAASRVKSFSVTEIVESLEATAGLPGASQRDIPERHASFAAVFEQSWGLLDRREREAFSCLSVTRDGFDRHSAAAMTGDAAVAGSLARQSLLIEDGRGRYRFHELVRQAAAARLDATARHRAEVAHARHYLAAMADATPRLNTPGARRLIEGLVPDLDNVRAAWMRAIRHQLVNELGRALDGLCGLFEACGLGLEAATLVGLAADGFGDGRLEARDDVDEASFRLRQASQLVPFVNDLSADALCDRVLTLTEHQPGREADAARALLERARSSAMRLELARADEYLDRAHALAESLGDPNIDAWIIAHRGRMHTSRGEFAQATRRLERALGLFSAQGDLWAQSRMHSYLAPAYAEQYLAWRALVADRRALELAELVGNHQQSAALNANVGASLVLLGDYEGARGYTMRALETVRRTGDWVLEGYVMVQLAECLNGVGDPTGGELMERGIGLERERRDDHGSLYSLVPWSRWLLGKGRLAQAELATDELIDVATRLGAEHFALTARLIRARVDLAAGRVEQATEAALAGWAAMNSDESFRQPWPIDSRIDIVEVVGLDHPVGSLAFDEAVNLRRSTARSIDDPAIRRAFIENLPVSKTIDALAGSD